MISLSYRGIQYHRVEPGQASIITFIPVSTEVHINLMLSNIEFFCRNKCQDLNETQVML